MADFQKLQDKYRGCLVGGAVGDALGFTVEFFPYYKIVEEYGRNGITEYDIKDGGKAKISDDTQMTYFTGNAFRNLDLTDITRIGKKEIVNTIYNQYLIWVKGQLEGYDKSSKLNPVLFEHRAPGNTCMTALLGKEKGTPYHKINDSKGSGGIMRVAPIGLIGAQCSYADIFKLGVDAAAITHTHELGYIPAGILVAIIKGIVNGEKLERAIDKAVLLAQDYYISDENQRIQEYLIQKAKEFSQKDMSDEEAINMLGDGWVAEEAIAIAIYCALKHIDSFDDAVVAAVNHGGDSDTTGAITGNIMGALLGYDAIPEEFKHNLELEEDLLELAENLFINIK